MEGERYKLRIVLELDGREVLVEESYLWDLWNLADELGVGRNLGATGKRFMDSVMAVSAAALDRVSDGGP